MYLPMQCDDVIAENIGNVVSMEDMNLDTVA